MGGKSLLYDLSSKIPCFIYDPRAPSAQRGKTMDQLVSSLDIPRTILDYAGVEPLEFMDGKSLKPLVYGETKSWRSELFLESLYTGRDNPFQEGIRIGKWKYIRMYDGVEPYDEQSVDFSNREPEFEMLFDLNADPGETQNRIEEMGDTQFLEDLRQKTANYSVALNEQRETYKEAVTTQTR